MKRVVVCCDGTWNTPDQTDGGVPAPTNVTRLYNALLKGMVGADQQLCYYHPGVGTDPGWFSKLTGGGLGDGLDRNIMSGYRYLCEHYEAGAEIFLFGFSRGAYTARSLGGMIGCCDILDIRGVKESDAWARIETVFREGYREGDPDARTAARKEWAKRGWTFHPTKDGITPIRFVGVWDTVGSLGVPDYFSVLNLLDDPKDHSFHDTRLGKAVETARHAIAIDEMRGSFQPTLWTEVGDRDVRQVWFPGVHCDVGGGYKETGLSDAALKWMLDEAQRCGLAFAEQFTNQIRPNHHDVLHDSLTGVYTVLPTQPRSCPRFSVDEPTLHGSAKQRHGDPPIAQGPYRVTSILAAPGDSTELDVFAIQPWNATGLYLEAGCAYRLAADGEWLDSGISCGPGGTNDGKFHPGEAAQMLGSALGAFETLWKKVTGNRGAEFLMTKRHEEMPWFCLVGAIANSLGVDETQATLQHETKEVGKGCEWTPTKSGYLYAYANDAWGFYKNNRGKIRLTVARLT
ncbi:MAG: DUF2235 domain-containing protein [Alphaproteobacteria bacterium]|nr:DUF2235 domain-containing protein [Alphaproteobacteria bacterium]